MGLLWTLNEYTGFKEHVLSCCIELAPGSLRYPCESSVARRSAHCTAQIEYTPHNTSPSAVSRFLSYDRCCYDAVRVAIVCFCLRIKIAGVRHSRWTSGEHGAVEMERIKEILHVIAQNGHSGRRVDRVIRG